MKYNSKLHRRKSIRLKVYDYSSKGSYFITICVKNRKRLFGEVHNQIMHLNSAGNMIEKWYLALPNKFHDIKCNAFMVMPNHFHCIIENVGSEDSGEHGGSGILGEHGGSGILGEHGGSPLPRVVQWFKTMTTNEYIRNVKMNQWERFDGKLWQRNYWEHIIKTENAFRNITKYINDNPRKWKMDNFNR